MTLEQAAYTCIAIVTSCAEVVPPWLWCFSNPLGSRVTPLTSSPILGPATEASVHDVATVSTLCPRVCKCSTAPHPFRPLYCHTKWDGGNATLACLRWLSEDGQDLHLRMQQHLQPLRCAGDAPAAQPHPTFGSGLGEGLRSRSSVSRHGPQLWVHRLFYPPLRFRPVTPDRPASDTLRMPAHAPFRGTLLSP
jgi:hypothetical protein